MVIVDSSVWINYFNSVDNEETKRLIFLLKVTQVATGDLIILEVLRGFRQDKDYETASELLLALPFFTLVDKRLALSAARNYRYLRKKGITIRKSTDVIIATFCIENDFVLLHSDRDFLPFETHLGLKNALRAID